MYESQSIEKFGAKIASWLGVKVEFFSCFVRYFSTTKILLHDAHDEAFPNKNNMFKALVIVCSNSCCTAYEGLRHQCCTFTVTSYICKKMVDRLCFIAQEM